MRCPATRWWTRASAPCGSRAATRFSITKIPQAAIALKQGFGRLIRAKSDRGVLVMLDNRITKQRYGQIFFDSLPDYAFTTERRDVEQWFSGK